ncbi:MAG: hypothetical protein JNK16_11545 [Phycisphaerales bacterium]|nr:hypothetical protein [Phycisphaerales bacterium]
MPTEQKFSRVGESFDKKVKLGLRGAGLVDLEGRILTGSALKKSEHGGGELGTLGRFELKLSA